jgi:hypothetical protein
MPDKVLPPGVVIVDSGEATGLVPNLPLSVAHLGNAKRGDFVRVVIKFSSPAIPGVPAGSNPKTQPAIPEVPANPRATEFITALIASKTPNGLLKIKVYSRPQNTQYHSISYGDEMTISERHVITHEASPWAMAQEIEHVLTGVLPEAQPVNAEDAKLRAAVKDFPPLPPEIGGEYWLRNGVRVRIWGFHAGVWVGGPVSEQITATFEWTALGAHAGGNKEMDIVKNVVQVS